MIWLRKLRVDARAIVLFESKTFLGLALVVAPMLALVFLAIMQAEADESNLRHEGFVAVVEGPAWRSDGIVFFTDVFNDKIIRREKDGTLQVHRTPSGHANGLLFDSQDRMLIAEHEGRLVRENLDGTIEVLADKYKNKPFNAINDIALDSVGRIYFTDPVYFNRKNASQRDADGKVIDGVYCFDEFGEVRRVLTHEVDMPNGLVVSPGDQYLYVADYHALAAGGARKLWRFNLDNTGNVITGSQKLIYDWGTDGGPDGMAIDIRGNIYVAAGLNLPREHVTSLVHKTGIYVISPEGDLLNFIAIPMDSVTNVTFGGEDFKTLFITAGQSLLSYKVDTPGYRPF